MQVVIYQHPTYNNVMAKDIENLNKYEIELNKRFTEIMETEGVKFPVFLPALIENAPDKASPEYLKILKKEHMKYRRASLTLEEVVKMLNIVQWKLQFSLDNKPIEVIDVLKLNENEKIRIRFTDFMYICELFNIKINWVKSPIEGLSNNPEKF